MLYFTSILVHPQLILLAVMFILGVIDFDDQLAFRYILPERFMVNKLDLNSNTNMLIRRSFSKRSNFYTNIVITCAAVYINVEWIKCKLKKFNNFFLWQSFD